MIKKITMENIEEISNLFIKAFNGEPWNDEWTYETASKRLVDIINMPGYKGMAYYHEGALAGMIMGRDEQYFNGIHFQILEFCVDKNIQGKGFGRKLLTEFTEKLKNDGVERIYLYTIHGPKTEGFYEKNGYVSDDDMLIMSKSIK
ncbi:GNAT family N-acetyltransferase [uncultured Clostridium sp.]|uniref:GNAT family N-acetyltransferase n=1 Tax=uncultured Clostridium sp. TaxID=59620 RepID=UPI0025F45CF7|nr:GNAT family N-acetyltransferase [uncultured Clostridium sp.]